MFKILRKALIATFLLCLAGVGFYFWHDPGYRRTIVQTADEFKEKIQDGDKKFAWSGLGVVAEVLKGDTVVVSTEGRPKVPMRMVGIDAPEPAPTRKDTAQPLSAESKDYLSKMILGESVEVDIVAVDSNRRPIVLISRGGTNINVKMVEAGLAEMYDEYLDRLPARTRNAIANAESDAKQNRMGIWGLSDYQRPSEYRIRHQPTAR